MRRDAALDERTEAKFALANLRVGKRLTTQEARRLRAQWRDVFAAEGTDWRARTANPEWHLFSSNVLPSPSPRGVVRAYELARQTCEKFWISFGWQTVLEISGQPPVYEFWPQAFGETDMYIIGDDWSWSLVRTHEEQGMGLGPYFATAL